MSVPFALRTGKFESAPTRAIVSERAAAQETLSGDTRYFVLVVDGLSATQKLVHLHDVPEQISRTRLR